jgi:hypothetical protein
MLLAAVLFSASVFITIFNNGQANEKCKETRFIGAELHKRTQHHTNQLRVFLDQNNIVTADGKVIAWQFIIAATGSKFYLDIWGSIGPPLKFKLVGKTLSASAPLGLNTVYLKTPITVSMYCRFQE